MEQRMYKLENDLKKAEIAAAAAARANERARRAAEQQAQYQAALIAEQERLNKRRSSAAGMAMLFGALSAVIEPQSSYSPSSQSFTNTMSNSSAFQSLQGVNPDLSGSLNNNLYYDPQCELQFDAIQGGSALCNYTGTISCY